MTQTHTYADGAESRGAQARLGLPAQTDKGKEEAVADFNELLQEEILHYTCWTWGSAEKELQDDAHKGPRVYGRGRGWWLSREEKLEESWQQRE